jgi:hypothetical protein
MRALSRDGFGSRWDVDIRFVKFVLTVLLSFGLETHESSNDYEVIIKKKMNPRLGEEIV